MRGVVVQRADDDTASIFEDERGVAAARVGEIAHFTGVAAGEPFVEICEFGKFFRADDGAEGEAELFGVVAEPVSGDGVGHGIDCDPGKGELSRVVAIGF